MTFIVQSYFDTLLRRYAVTFCGAVVLKVMDQKTVVKRRGGYKGASIKPGTWNIPEHSGTSRHIPEQEKIKIKFHEKKYIIK